MTFTLISTVYACGIAKPGHGSHTPYAVGLALLACAGSGGQYTGAALNPARVLGPLAVFGCGKDVAWIYILAQFTASVLACFVFGCVSGPGPLNPFVAMPMGLTWYEATSFWISGSPPARLRAHGKENMMDLIDLLKKMKDREALASSEASANSEVNVPVPEEFLAEPEVAESTEY